MESSRCVSQFFKKRKHADSILVLMIFAELFSNEFSISLTHIQLIIIKSFDNAPNFNSSIEHLRLPEQTDDVHVDSVTIANLTTPLIFNGLPLLTLAARESTVERILPGPRAALAW